VTVPTTSRNLAGLIPSTQSVQTLNRIGKCLEAVVAALAGLGKAQTGADKPHPGWMKG